MHVAALCLITAQIYVYANNNKERTLSSKEAIVGFTFNDVEDIHIYIVYFHVFL